MYNEDWSNFGKKTISGLKFGALSGLTISSIYLGISSRLTNPRNIPLIDAGITEKRAVPLKNLYFYDNFEGLYTILSRLHL